MNSENLFGDVKHRHHEEDVGDHLVDEHDRDAKDHGAVSGKEVESVA